MVIRNTTDIWFKIIDHFEDLVVDPLVRTEFQLTFRGRRLHIRPVTPYVVVTVRYPPVEEFTESMT